MNANTTRNKADGSENAIHRVKCTVNDDTHVPFLANQSFCSHLIDYVKQEIVPIEIVIEKTLCDHDPTYPVYDINLTGTRQQNRTAKHFIRHLFESIQVKEYQEDHGMFLIQ